jgi:zinc transport system ATP-binding protein
MAAMAPEHPEGAEVLARARGLGVARGGSWLIREVDLTVRRGRIVTLIGPNGSGKTTTARAVLGLERPTAGTVERKAGLRVGYLPQRLTVDPVLPLTVRRFIGLTRAHAAAAVDAALGEVGIAHLVDRQLHQLSGGEFQRAALARAIAGGPDLLVLDEPVKGVDFTGAIALYELIGKVRDRLGCGVLLISHDLHVVMAATDTVVCLNGHVCCQGTPEAVTANPEYARLFGPRAAAALALYRHDHDHVHRLDGAVVAAGNGGAGRAGKRRTQTGHDHAR